MFYDPTMKGVLAAGKDAFAINYGTGGISAEVYANRIGVGRWATASIVSLKSFS